MAQQDPSRTEKATPKRRNKARNKGSVPKSSEITKASLLLVGLISMHLYIRYMTNELLYLYSFLLKSSFSFVATTDSVYNLFITISMSLAKILLPVMLTLALAAFIVMRLQVGELWTTEIFFQFNLAKNLNIIAGLKKLIISPQALVRLGRSLAQAIIIAIAPYIVLKQEFLNLAPLFYQNVEGIAAYILGAGATMVKYTLGPVIAVGIVDLIYTRWDYEENLKMTKDEIKDERKQAEGDPVIKRKQRQEMLKVMARRMLEQVPKADVVITNPTHVAVALRYSALESPAPMVVAKGLDHLAKKIKDIALEHGVPIREDPPLARALYKSVEVGEAIPEEFFKAVASILAKLQKFRRGA